MVASNKDRLYVSLYARGGTPTMEGNEDKYHWALMVGPKVENDDGRGYRYSVRDQPLRDGGKIFTFEERETGLQATTQQLARIMVGKILDKDRLVAILRSVPIENANPQWNCVSWVRNALEMIKGRWESSRYKSD